LISTGFPITELHACGLEDLCGQLGTDDASWIIADLSLGAWRGALVAHELCSQLGIARPLSGREGAASDSPSMSYADQVGIAIDREAGGRALVVEAREAAIAIAGEARRQDIGWVIVVAPRFGTPWRQHDGLVVRYLAEELDGRNCSLAVVRIDAAPPVPTDGMILDLVPGTLGPDELAAVQPLLAQRLASDDYRLHALRGGHLLIPPEHRRAPASVARNDWQRLAVISQPLGWLSAYVQLFLNASHVHPGVLAAQAGARQAELGDEIALELLDRAATVCSGTWRAAFLAYAQGLRIAGQRFAEAAACEEPDGGADPVLRGFLTQCKGWGLVMQDEPRGALEYFDRARGLLEPIREHHPREFLWLLNITALAHVRLGDGDAAMMLERSIEHELAGWAAADWHLIYVNSLNIARLLRRSGDAAGAERYFRTGFATASGTQSPSDAVYRNVCLATVAHGAEAERTAVWRWLRACLHWLANPVPESIAPRVATGIVGGRVEDHDVVERVSARLLDRLTQAAALAGMSSPQGPCALSEARFAQAQPSNGATPRLVVGVAGCSFILADGATPSRDLGAAHDTLRRTTLSLLAHLTGLDAGVEACRLVLVDDRCGREMALTGAEAELTAARYGVSTLRFEDRVTALDAEARAAILGRARLSLSPAVQSVTPQPDGATVRFRRYRPPLTISVQCTRLLAELASSPRLDEVRAALAKHPPDSLPSEVHELEEQRVIVLDPSSPVPPSDARERA